MKRWPFATKEDLQALSDQIKESHGLKGRVATLSIQKTMLAKLLARKEFEVAKLTEEIETLRSEVATLRSVIQYAMTPTPEADK